MEGENQEPNPVMNALVMEPTGIRSKNSNRHSYVRFINATERRVDVIWINYEGVRVKYKTLDPAEYFDVTSFVSHPWVFLDAETHTKLVVSSKEIFDCPAPNFVRLGEGIIRPTRAHVTISLPIYSLHECALQTVQRCLRNPRDAYRLEVPAPIQKELFQRCSLSWGMRSNNRS